jgi:acetyltransferase-like isoleucine patch superfamily enzyme
MNYLKRNIKYIYNKFRLRRAVKFDSSSMISLFSKFEGLNRIGHNTHVNGYFGRGSYVCDYSYIIAKLGKFVSIGSYVRINPGMHPYKSPYVSTSPYFVSTRKQNGYTLTNIDRFDEIKYVDAEKKYPVIIGNDCWIGDGAFITGGISIGDGAVVLAHAVVTKDVPPYAIVGGIPAKVINYRYDDDTIGFLLRFQWWNMSEKWLSENIDLMCDIDKLYSTFNE